MALNHEKRIKLLSLTYATRVFPEELNDKRDVDLRTTPLSTDPPDFSDCTDKWSSESDWLHAPITSISSVMKKLIIKVFLLIIEGNSSSTQIAHKKKDSEKFQ